MSRKQTIVDLEKKFWDTMISKDVGAATGMMAKNSIIIGPQGISEISRSDFAKLMEESKWTLDSYDFSDVQVLFPTEDTAVIGYRVKQKGTMDGKPYSMEAADASTWTRDGESWHCALHTETMVGKPSGTTAR
ncbi:nuclear transport factor 2 family protein [Arvimicrobium flavum]|uniref:nuclear transport factor 2 family protein n=1 Tax=Arvimicrobium flavum TaxID=3393320 RepID=UPI00237A8CDF|nr:nuclear transport factor 2 family protein [Mesorhizobium shangrilense]